MAQAPIHILTANVNSWRTMSTWALQRKEHILLLQETRVTDDGIAGARRAATEVGWSSAWSPAVPNRAGPASGGLAVLCKGMRRMQMLPHPGTHASRWMHVVVETTAGNPLHIFTLYGYDKGQPEQPWSA